MTGGTIGDRCALGGVGTIGLGGNDGFSIGFGAMATGGDPFCSKAMSDAIVLTVDVTGGSGGRDVGFGAGGSEAGVNGAGDGVRCERSVSFTGIEDGGGSTGGFGGTTGATGGGTGGRGSGGDRGGGGSGVVDKSAIEKITFSSSNLFYHSRQYFSRECG